MEDIKALIKENKQNLVMFGMIVVALITILMGVLIWKLPTVSVCIFVLLEAGLAMCLQNLPVWLHGAVLIVQLMIGLFVGNGLFLLTCAVYYGVNILFLYFWNK